MLIERTARTQRATPSPNSPRTYAIVPTVPTHV
jgi:hypothetical protein